MKFSDLNSIPWLLKIASFATIGIGSLQLLSLFIPSLGSGIDGQALTSPFLVIFMGVFHILIGLAILTINKIAIPLLIVLPAIQYGVFYLNHGIPSSDTLQLHAIFSGVWGLFFCGYLFCTKAKYYFQGHHSA